jgi:opacity protein-like surface antigen
MQQLKGLTILSGVFMRILLLSKIFSNASLIALGLMSSVAVFAQDQGSNGWRFSGENLRNAGWNLAGDQSAGKTHDPQAKRIPKIETFVSLGEGTFWGGNVNEGSGLEVQGGVRFHPFVGRRSRHLGFGFRLGRLEHDRQSSDQFWSNSVSGTVVTALGEVSYRFGNSRVQPYVSVGLGGVRSDHTHKDTYLSDSSLFTHSIAGSDLGFSFGTGLKVGVFKGLSVVPECRLLTTVQKWNWQVAGLGVGLSYGW